MNIFKAAILKRKIWTNSFMLIIWRKISKFVFKKPDAPKKIIFYGTYLFKSGTFFPVGLVENWLHIYQRKYAILNYAQTDVVFHNNDLRWLFIFLLCTSQKSMTCIHFLDIFANGKQQVYLLIWIHMLQVVPCHYLPNDED